MTLHGTVQNGVVVFDGNPAIPDGKEVTVVVAPVVKPVQGEQMTEEERLRVLSGCRRRNGSSRSRARA